MALEWENLRMGDKKSEIFKKMQNAEMQNAELFWGTGDIITHPNVS